MNPIQKYSMPVLCIKVGFLSCFLWATVAFSQKKYQKNYDQNNQLMAEGWVENSKKTGYWKFYYAHNGVLKKEGRFNQSKPIKYWYFYRENSTKEKEGHFIAGKKSNWWLFYDHAGKLYYKCQLKNDQKNGFCLQYNDGKLIQVEKYKEGIKINEWTDAQSFKRENNLSDLR
jgi:antitoxin component YwqK of YwqJK toxin-antitoxin module